MVFSQILSSRKTRIKTISELAFISLNIAQILSSRKTRIKTRLKALEINFVIYLRYYPPEKQGLRPTEDAHRCFICRLRYYPPEKQGLRLADGFHFVSKMFLRYYPPEKQGLRPLPAY